MKTRFAAAVLLGLLSFVGLAFGWQRDIPLEPLPASPQCSWGDYFNPNSGVVVEDVVPSWPGKEIIVATYDTVRVIRADNSDVITLTIPDIRPHPTMSGYNAICDAQTPELIAGVPAVGDVDNDGFNEIVVGITNKFEFWQDNSNTLEKHAFYSTLVWWKLDPNQSTPAFIRYYVDLTPTPTSAPVFLGTPVICRTGYTGGAATVVCYGPSFYMYGGWGHSSDVWQETHGVTSFDLRNPLNPLHSYHELPNWSTEALTYLALGRGGMTCVQAADLNGDGLDELVVHNSRYIRALQWNNTDWGYLENFGGAYYYYDLWSSLEAWRFASGSFSLADIDNDGAIDILAPASYSYQGIVRSYLLQINLSGNLANHSDISTDWQQKSVPAVANWSSILPSQQLERTLNPIIQTGANTNGLRPDLGILDHWPVPRLNSTNAVTNLSSPIAADLAGLGYAQFIDASIGRTTIGTDEINAYDPRNPTQPVITIDLNVPWPGIWTEYSIPSVPAVADMDGDGTTDLVVSYRTAENNIRIFKIDTTVSFNRELAQWQQFQNGPAHKGLYAQPVTGTQQLTEATWEGRITVHGTYTVGVNCTLTIRPGTVVEFEPDAYLSITGGTLNALGTDNDSIYFRPKGASNNGSMLLQTTATLSHCVIHDLDNMEISQEAGTVQIEACHIYNMNRRASQIDAAAKNKIDSIN